MVKTIRLESDELHKELKMLQGEMIADTGESTSLEDVIDMLLTTYRLKTKRKKR